MAAPLPCPSYTNLITQTMLLMVNVDDISGEVIPHVIDGLMARGASSGHAVQAITKKGRIGYLFFVDAPEGRVDALANFLAGELGTLGVRVFDPHHICFEYRIRQVRLTAQNGAEPVHTIIRVKEILEEEERRIISVKAEWEDLQAALVQLEQAGLAVSLTALKRLVEQAVSGHEDGSLRDLQTEVLP